MVSSFRYRNRMFRTLSLLLCLALDSYQRLRHHDLFCDAGVVDYINDLCDIFISAGRLFRDA